MYSLLYLAVLSFAICFLLTPVVRNAMHRVGVLDQPDRARKIHNRPIPRLAGVPIAVASLGLLALTPLRGTELLLQIMPLLPAACLVFVIGLLDDLYDLKPWQKIGGQMVAATWRYYYGFRIQAVAGFGFGEAHWIMYPLTVGWLLACANAFNLIDGVGRPGVRRGLLSDDDDADFGVAARQYAAVDSDGAVGGCAAGLLAV
jgi:UDP-GlcNAc:undecaprenyl-phosphate GlcNAc-1-phosphate transferase